MQFEPKQVLDAALRLTYEKGRWTMTDLARAMGTKQLYAHHQPTRGLIRDGKIAKFGASSDTEYAASGVWNLTLAGLLERAETCVNSALKRDAGRRAKVGESRSIHELTPSQWRYIRAMAGKIAGYLADPGEDPDAVLHRMGVQYFVWDASGGDGGAGEWTAFLSLARAASVAKAGPNNPTLGNDVGAARTLLDLAATHGWIPRASQHAEDFRRIPAEWAPLYEQWRSVLRDAWSTGNRSCGNTKQAILELLGACSVLGSSPDAADWGIVMAFLEAHWESNGAPSHIRTYARRAYRTLREMRLLTGPALAIGGLERVALVPGQAVLQVAQAYGSDQNGAHEGGTWKAPNDEVWRDWLPLARGLVEGPYGLRRFLEYQTVPEGRTARVYGLPPRAKFPREQIREQNKRRARKAWRTGTITMHVKRITLYAGWLAHERGVDFSQPGNDLRVLLDAENLHAFEHAVLRGKFSSVWQFVWLVSALARIASPYLEAVALEIDDEKTADEMARVATLLDSDDEEALKASLAAQLPSQDEVVKRQARATEDALTQHGRLATSAYEMFIIIRNALVDQAIAHAGGLSLDGQIERIRAGAHFSREWARRIQEAQLVQDQLIAPLRSETLCRMDLGMRMSSGSEPHRGRHFAQYPARIMKGGRPFAPEYLRAEDNHPDSAAWGLYDPRIYGLYLVDGGARQILLTRGNGERWRSSAFYVPDVQTNQARINRSDARLTLSALTYVRQRLFAATQPVTGLPDWDELRRQGGAANHCHRHAFGSFHAPRNLLFASKMLHHEDTRTTEKWYCNKGEDNMGGAGAAAAGLGPLG